MIIHALTKFVNASLNLFYYLRQVIIIKSVIERVYESTNKIVFVKIFIFIFHTDFSDKD